jgi:hypothetical protein
MKEASQFPVEYFPKLEAENSRPKHFTYKNINAFCEGYAESHYTQIYFGFIVVAFKKFNRSTNPIADPTTAPDEITVVPLQQMGSCLSKRKK